MIDRSLNHGRHIIRHFMASLPPASHILDMGAGTGEDLTAARTVLPQAHLYALESYAPYIEKLRSRQIDVRPINIERDPFPFQNESLDGIVANQIFEHVKEIFWILHQISRCLRVNGQLLIGVPNLAAWHNRALLLVGRQPSPLKNTSAHLRGYTKPDLLRLLRVPFPNGFELHDFKGSNFYPLPPILAQPLAGMFPSLAASIFFRFKKIKPYNGEFLRFPGQEQLETNFYLGPSQTDHLLPSDRS